MFRRLAQPSPKVGDRNYNRMKYYSALKTTAVIGSIETGVDSEKVRQDFLDVPEHMLEIQESAFVPSYGGKLVI